MRLWTVRYPVMYHGGEDEAFKLEEATAVDRQRYETNRRDLFQLDCGCEIEVMCTLCCRFGHCRNILEHSRSRRWDVRTVFFCYRHGRREVAMRNRSRRAWRKWVEMSERDAKEHGTLRREVYQGPEYQRYLVNERKAATAWNARTQEVRAALHARILEMRRESRKAATQAKRRDGR
jgi:hypothetical protein